jgi:hypothetical protein
MIITPNTQSTLLTHTHTVQCLTILSGWLVKVARCVGADAEFIGKGCHHHVWSAGNVLMWIFL